MVRPTGTFLLFIMLPFLAACATGAQKTASQIRANFDAASHEMNACVSAANSKPEVSSVFVKRPKNYKNVTLAQLGDKTFATPQQRKGIILYHAMIKPCREIAFKALQTNLPLGAPVYSRLVSQHDILYSDLIDKKISWGKFNKRMVSLQNQFDAEIAKLDQLYINNLQIAHQQEIQQRQAIAGSIQSWSQQQQILNSINRTRTTNCRYIGSTINCTSF